MDDGKILVVMMVILRTVRYHPLGRHSFSVHFWSMKKNHKHQVLIKKYN